MSLFPRKASFKHCWHVPFKAIQQYLGTNKGWIQKLELQDCYWLKQGAQLVTSIKKCTNLVSVDVSGCSVSQKNVIEIMEKCTNLKHFGWTVDKKTYNDFRLPIGDTSGQAKQLNLCFRKLLSIKLVLFDIGRGSYEFAEVGLVEQERICSILLSNLCLKRLELHVFTKGLNVFHPLHIVMESNNGIEILKQKDQYDNNYLAKLIKCFPLNNSTTINFSFSTFYGYMDPMVWEDEQFDDILHLRNIDISGNIILKMRQENICKLLSCPSLEYIKIGKEQHSDALLLSICSPVLRSINLENSENSLVSDVSEKIYII